MKTRILAFITLVLLGSGCDPEVRACNRKCDCERCSDREFDECLDDLDDRWEDADRRNCRPEYRDLLRCENATWVCDDGDYETDCGPERRDFRNCID